MYNKEEEEEEEEPMYKFFWARDNLKWVTSSANHWIWGLRGAHAPKLCRISFSKEEKTPFKMSWSVLAI